MSIGLLQNFVLGTRHKLGLAQGEMVFSDTSLKRTLAFSGHWCLHLSGLDGLEGLHACMFAGPVAVEHA